MSFNKSAFILIFLLPVSLFCQTGFNTWSELPFSGELSARINADLVLPPDTRVFHFDNESLQEHLRSSASRGESNISLPVGEDGSLVAFRMVYDPVLGKNDRLKYSDIKTFYIEARDGSGISGRVGTSASGFYGIIENGNQQLMLRHGEGADNDKIFVYSLDKKMALLDGNILTSCGTEYQPTSKVKNNKLSLRNEERRMRHFRIVISCTSGYAAKVGATPEKVLEKIVQSINLLNQRYNIDFGIKLDLIDNDERFFNLIPNQDYFVNQDKGLDLLQQNQDFLDSLISPDEYDLAQVFTKTCSDVGGVVWGRACDNVNKARGVSCRSDDEDYFFTTFKHEVGHQFDGGHTFNACNGSSQFNPGSSYEPGAGSTILSYGNNCGTDNVGERKEYFHVINILEITNYAIESEALCGTFGPDINHTPDARVLSPAGVVVPALTPFELEGIATDIDGDQLSYNWEQFDLGEGQPLGTNFETGPLFVSQDPRASGHTRLFPNLSNLISGVVVSSERLPEVSREMNFKMTVRDNDPTIATQTIVDYKFDVTDQAGPFRITFPTSGVDTTFTLGQYVLVTWDVADTDKDPINCKFVNIIHSNTDGQIFADTLVVRTPNDGSEYVMMPRVTGKSRIKVKAADNIFLDIAKKPFKVVMPTDAGYSLDLLPHNGVVCKNSVFEYKVRSVKFQDYNTPVKIEVINQSNPNLIIFTSSDQFLPGEQFSIFADTKDLTQAGNYTIEFRAIAEGYDTIYRKVTLQVSGDEQKFVGEKTPANLDQSVTLNPVFEWNKISGSKSYEVQISQDPSFSTVLYAVNSSDSKFTYPGTLTPENIYFWRVRSLGECGFGRWSELLIFRTSSSQTQNILQQVNNIVLEVRTGGAKYLNRDNLYYFSLQQTDEVLTYKLLTYPEHGTLSIGLDQLSVGSTFTQQDIDDQKLLYSTNEPDYQGADNFMFLAYDAIGTFLGPEAFTIDVNDANPAGIKNVEVDHLFTLTPNPAGNTVRIVYSGKDILRNVEIKTYSTAGSLISSEKHDGIWTASSLDISSYVSGTYIVVVKSGNYISKKRLVKL